MKINRLIIILLVLLLSCSCTNSSQDTGDNLMREMVMNYYKIEDPNQEKEKAAEFLFKHMKNKYSFFDRQNDSILNYICDSILNSESSPDKNEMVRLLKSKAAKNILYDTIWDYSSFSSIDLIEHIDITYNNWKKLSAISCATYHDFCEYILPYRVMEEPFLSFSTKQFETSFKPFIDTLAHTDSIIPAISGFIRDIACKIDLSLSAFYPAHFSVKHLNQIKVAARCDDMAIYISLALRSIGIPAAYEYIPQWGNHPYYGHSWLAVKWQEKWYAFDAFNGNYLNQLYQKESIPKVYRKLFSISDEGRDLDITSDYQKTVHYRTIIQKKQKRIIDSPAVAVFNKFKEYNVVDLGRRKGSYLVFENLGRRVVYFFGGIIEGEFIALNNPYFVDSCGSFKQLVPDWEDQSTYSLYRKYPLTMGKRNRKKLEWARSLSGSWIEASADNFTTTDTLLVLKDYNSFIEEYYEVANGSAYNEVRYRCGPKNQIASLKFFDQKHDKLRGQIVHDLWKRFNPINVFDDDMLSWAWMGNPSRYVSVGYKFNEPQNISGIAVHARNDGNHIIVGDDYELRVYDNGWKSVGFIKASKQELAFDKVPADGLYWLINHSQGKEELPFMFDSEGNQFWAGE